METIYIILGALLIFVWVIQIDKMSSEVIPEQHPRRFLFYSITLATVFFFFVVPFFTTFPFIGPLVPTILSFRFFEVWMEKHSIFSILGVFVFIFIGGYELSWYLSKNYNIKKMLFGWLPLLMVILVTPLWLYYQYDRLADLGIYQYRQTEHSISSALREKKAEKIKEELIQKAIQQKNLNICKTDAIDPNRQDQCYVEVVKHLTNPSPDLCNAISEDSYNGTDKDGSLIYLRKTCYYNVAIATGYIELCNNGALASTSLSQDEKNQFCFNQFLTNLALTTRDITLCNYADQPANRMFRYEKKHPSCLSEFISKYKNKSLCYQYSSYEDCLVLYAGITGDISACKEFPDGNSGNRFWCYTNIAIFHRDSNICEQNLGGTDLEACLSGVKDRISCDNKDSEVNYDGCY
ncbi:MAG: hypothetical protein WCV73_01975 [Patescibacteria group bacterium]|jgi:hypothetical protein